MDLRQARRRDVGEVRDREVDPAGERRGQARPPRTLVDGEAAGTAGAGEGGLVEVDAVHVRVGQQDGQRRGQRAGAAAEVDDDAGIGTQGDSGGEDGLGPAAGDEDAGREGHPDRPELGPADDLLERTPGGAVGDGAGARGGVGVRLPDHRRLVLGVDAAGGAQGEHGLVEGHRDRVAGSGACQRTGTTSRRCARTSPASPAARRTSTGRAARRPPTSWARRCDSAITQPLSNRGRLTPAERNADDTVLAARAALADLWAACRRAWSSGAA